MNLDQYEAVLLDLDGTVYHEEHALPGAMELIHRLQREERRFACLSNSTSSPRRIAARLQRMGVKVGTEAIYTAGAAAADYVMATFSSSPGTPRAGRGEGSADLLIPHPNPPPEYREREQEGWMPRVYSLATEGVHELLEGKVRWVSTADEACDVVLVGTPTSVFATEERQRVALEILRRSRSTRLVGICADRVYPSPRGIEFGSGALTTMLAYAAKATPVFTGKPEEIFFRELCERLGVEPKKCLLIGDNLESDIAGGKNVGMATILTLTGVARREDLASLSPEKQPDGVIEDLTLL
jgi:HAD superfamily hydrolase (TIGR01450 family)